MKNNFKFIVMVFGVTLAVFGSMNAHALQDANGATIKCNGDTGGCAKIKRADGTSYWLLGCCNC